MEYVAWNSVWKGIVLFKIGDDMGICYIFGAGERCERSLIPVITEEDYVIVADGGLNWVRELSIEPHLIVGDFDSLGYIPNEPNVELHPVEKNDTDMGIAVERGFEKGYREFVLFGGTGGARLDHTFANVQLLHHIAKCGGRGYLVDNRDTLTVICDSDITISGNGGFSVFSLDSEAHGVTIEGAKYCVKDTVLTNDFSLGVSNEFADGVVRICVKKGTLLVMGAFSLDSLLEK